MSLRAIRRHHRERLKKNRKSYWGYGSRWIGTMDLQQLGMVVRTPALCSCLGCGNQRGYVGRPVKELRQYQFDPEIEVR